MRAVMAVVLWSVVLGLAGRQCGWTDRTHLLGGGLLLVLPLGLAGLYWQRKRTWRHVFRERVKVRPHLLRSLVLHGTGAWLCVAYLYAGFWLLEATLWAAPAVSEPASAPPAASPTPTPEEEFRKRLSVLRAGSDWRTLVSVLEAALWEDHPRVRDLPLAVWLRDALLAWAETQSAEAEKEELLERALAVCKQYQLDSEVARRTLARLHEERAERERPVPLPPGSTAGVLEVTAAHYPPVVLAEVWVEAANGQPVEGLQAKDFQVVGGGQRWGNVLTSPVTRAVQPFQVVLLVDTSGSMKGQALEAAQAGGRTFLAGLEPAGGGAATSSVEILTFDKVVRRLQPWTQDLVRARTSLNGLQAEGGTALLRALSVALDELRPRQGQKRVLLLTDGQDSEGGADLNRLLERCQKEQVVVDTIGLRTTGLDSTTLRRLAQESGGHYGEALAPAEFLEHYRQAARRLRPHSYRLVLTPPGEHSPKPVRGGHPASGSQPASGPQPASGLPQTPLELRVGGTNGVRLAVPLP
ncbi:MAG: VWA domain-containing protein [Gemmataceae bacterium]|nr:VWA domain-containing protein [Gemmataceae bacterium]